MGIEIVKAEDRSAWRKILSRFERVDVCQTPEYHLAYATRIQGSMPLLWTYRADSKIFCYPFMLTPVVLKDPGGRAEKTQFFDIESVYGYSGPLSSSSQEPFLHSVWNEFSDWAHEQNIIAEFVRFSLYTGSAAISPPDMSVEVNRSAAVSYLPGTKEEFFATLSGKTRNMIRKAERSGLSARKLDFKKWLPSFLDLYRETMERNSAGDFFSYDGSYFNHLSSLPEEERQLFGVFKEDRLVSAALALIHNRSALYHLGASLNDYIRLGAGNLCIFQMSAELLRQNVEFLNLGGGRTPSADDPLLGFKRRNATELVPFSIGKKIHNPVAYQAIVRRWEELNKKVIDFSKLIFYR